MDKESLAKQIENVKLKIHIKYICGISFACICLFIIARLCNDSTFKSCISVSSTVTSIILSVIAIILSVTGERTTNEIRDKLSDSVKQLESNANKSISFTEDLESTINKMNALYENMTENVINQFPQMQTSLNDLLHKDNGANEENPIDHIMRFYKNIAPKTRKYIAEAIRFMDLEGRKRPLQPGDILVDLMEHGADANMSNLVIGLIFGNMSTGALNGITLEEFAKRIEEE